MFLEEMAKQARNLITDICTEQCALSDQVRPSWDFPWVPPPHPAILQL